LPGCTVAGNRITAWTPPRHGAHPDPNGNMITVLSDAMLTSGLAHSEDRYIWEFLRRVSSDVDGELLGIREESEHMGALTVFARQIKNDNGCPEITLRIRHPESITYDQVVQRASAAAQQQGFIMTAGIAGTPMYIMDVNTPMVQMLRQEANSIVGTDAAPYVMGGGTYANRLPNAYVFGMDGNNPPKDFAAGRGAAHGVDESVSLDRLQRAMRIYARALLRLNELEW